MKSDPLNSLGRDVRELTALVRAWIGEEPPGCADWKTADAFVWHPRQGLYPVERVHVVDLSLLIGIDRQRDILRRNTEQFVRGFAANNALLWGARGAGKSSLVKAIHADINRHFEKRKSARRLKLIEIHREDIATLPQLMGQVRAQGERVLIYCDDLSFDRGDTSYKSLKSVLEGGIEGRPDNVLFYATSNRRHILARDMIENERGTAINPGDSIAEKVSLSDRFGIWLGFHACSQEDYLAMVEAYARHYGLAVEAADLRAAALEWAQTRGGRSGRVAWQFIQDLAGRLGRSLSRL